MPQVKPGSKYHPLYEHLRRRDEEEITLTFAEIERLLGARLPDSARTGRAFWSNRGRGALQAAAWMGAGYHVEAVDLDNQAVTFRRPIVRYRVLIEGDTAVWDAAMIKALRTHLGLSQADLAELLGVRQQTVSEWETGIYAPTRARSKHLTMVAERVDFPLEEGVQKLKGT